MKPQDIKTKRLKLGLTQAALGAALGVSGNAVALWERGERTPEAAQMLAMAMDHLLLQRALEIKLKTTLPKLHKAKAELEALVKEPLLLFTEEDSRPHQRARKKAG